MQKFMVLTLIILLNLVPCYAYFPSVEIKYGNVTNAASKGQEILEMKLLNFLEDEPKGVLQPEGKKYKVDQACSFTAELDADGNIDPSSLKLGKNKANPAYNLRLIQFLKLNKINLKKKDTEKPVTVEFKYSAF